MCHVNLIRLKKCMQRARRGEDLTIGFLGGSITQGSSATIPRLGYSYLVYSWWKKTFPKAEVHYVNGGIGGTTSHYGVSRAVEHVLMYQPDFVVVDFSVNDTPNHFFQETYEGVLRRLLTWDSKPAVLLLNNVFYDTGTNAQEYHNAVGEWYGVPYVSVKDTIYQWMRAGKYRQEELTSDGLHPNDTGHRLIAEEIIAFLENVKERMDEEEEEIGALPQPMTENAYENAKCLTIRDISPKLAGFRADTEEKKGHLDWFKNGWIGKSCGDSIVFKVTASCIAVQYKKTLNRPALMAKLILDGDEENPVLLDGNFEEEWGDCLYLEPVLHHGKREEHIVKIVVMDTEIKNAAPFYLVSLIVA